MKKLFLLTAVAIVLLAACNTQKSEKAEDTLSIAVSILPQQFLVDRISGGTVESFVMIPPGASPATYEPSSSQMRNLSHADVYFRIGHIAFEHAWMPRFRSNNTDMLVVDLSKDLTLLETAKHAHVHESGKVEEHHGVDPHTWTSPANMKKMSGEIFKTLSTLLPENQDVYQANLNKLNAEIDSLDAYLVKVLKPISKREFYIFHPALGYFSREYDLKQIPIEVEGKEPSASYMKVLVDGSKEKDIGIILVQKQFPIDKAQVIAEEIDAELIQIDPLAYSWIDGMKQLGDLLAKHLK